MYVYKYIYACTFRGLLISHCSTYNEHAKKFCKIILYKLMILIIIKLPHSFDSKNK